MNEKQNERYRRAHQGNVDKAVKAAMTVTPDELETLANALYIAHQKSKVTLAAAMESLGFIVERPIPVPEGAVRRALAVYLENDADQHEAMTAAIREAVGVMISQGTLKLPEGETVQCRCPRGDCEHR